MNGYSFFGAAVLLCAFAWLIVTGRGRNRRFCRAVSQGLERRRKEREQQFWDDRLRWVEKMIKQAKEQEQSRADQ